MAAGEGNPVAACVFRNAVRTYGRAIAQAITLVSPEIVVVGGGAPRARECFLRPIADRGGAVRPSPSSEHL